MKKIQRLVLVSASLALVASAPAQTLYTINGNGAASPFAIVAEQTGPPAGPCLWPNGPYLGGFLTNPPFPCPTVAGFNFAGLAGDIAVARGLDLLYVTDGTNITLYTPNGAPQRSFTLANVLPTFGTITGLGYDGPGGVLWVCNATTAVGIVPPGPANCPALVTIMVAPFALPAVGAPYTDIDWDPVQPSLYACTTAGHVVNVFPGGLPAGYGIQTPPLTCATGGLSGLAMDDSYFGGPAAMYVTDGFMIERITPIAGPPASTFYATSACFPATSPPISGLAYSAHGIGYGTASPPDYPILFTSGQTISPNPSSFAFHLSGPPGSFGFLFVGLGGYQCAPYSIPPMLIYINTPALFVQGPIPASGLLTIPVSIPSIGIGFPATTLFWQGFVFSGGAFSSSNGLATSIARP